MARILIIGGGCRGRELAREILAMGHAARITTRSPAAREAIEASGAECFVGTPDRLASLRGALDGIAIACWLLAGASGTREAVRALHGARLGAFLHQTIDSTVRALVYERGAARGDCADSALLDAGARVAREVSERNAIPLTVLTADIRAREEWLEQARSALGGLLGE